MKPGKTKIVNFARPLFCPEQNLHSAMKNQVTLHSLSTDTASTNLGSE